jgi:glycosyltransferase involved in cell wall biosynthesis
LMTLADALAKIKTEKWNLLIVGDGEERSKLEKRLIEFGLFERARFTGAVSYDQTPDYFRQIDILVVPTQTTAKIREQFGRVIIEAMACGTAVVGSTSGAIPEVIADAGIVFPENEPESLAAELRRLIYNRNLLASLSEKGRKRVETYYTWENVAEKIFSLYCRVLQQNSVGSPELCFNE